LQQHLFTDDDVFTGAKAGHLSLPMDKSSPGLPKCFIQNLFHFEVTREERQSQLVLHQRKWHE